VHPETTSRESFDALYSDVGFMMMHPVNWSVLSDGSVVTPLKSPSTVAPKERFAIGSVVIPCGKPESVLLFIISVWSDVSFVMSLREFADVFIVRLATLGIKTEHIWQLSGTLRDSCTLSFTAASEKEVTAEHLVQAGDGGFISLHEQKKTPSAAAAIKVI
jgi:hypothetical protein